MKKVLLSVLILVLCTSCLVSCSALTQEIGKTVSVQALDHLENELREQASFDELTRYGDASEVPGLVDEWEAANVELKGEVTGALYGTVSNPATGYWGNQLSLGLSATEDVDTLMEYYEQKYATEIQEGRAVLIDGGWMISITVSSMPIEQAN